MRGQVQIVTALLLTGIAIMLVVAAYLWGIPLIQKQQDIVTLDNSERFMRSLDEKIQEVVRHGGREVIPVNLPGELKISSHGKINGREINDTIQLEFSSKNMVMATNKTIVLKGSDTDMEKPIGAEAGILTVFSEDVDGEYIITFSLKYRFLRTADYLYKIDLVPVGRALVGPGDRRITVTSTGTEVIKKDGFDLHVAEVGVRLE